MGKLIFVPLKPDALTLVEQLEGCLKTCEESLLAAQRRIAELEKQRDGHAELLEWATRDWPNVEFGPKDVTVYRLEPGQGEERAFQGMDFWEAMRAAKDAPPFTGETISANDVSLRLKLNQLTTDLSSAVAQNAALRVELEKIMVGFKAVTESSNPSVSGPMDLLLRVVVSDIELALSIPPPDALEKFTARVKAEALKEAAVRADEYREDIANWLHAEAARLEVSGK